MSPGISGVARPSGVGVRIGMMASPRRVWVELRDNDIGIP
jgi:hypothetical protein